MRKVILFFGLLLFIGSAGYAQKGKNQINIGPELDIPMGTFGDAFKLGFGGTVKGLFGIGKSGQITLTTGYLSFKGKSGTTEGGYSYADQKFSILPILAGYRQNIKTFYVEPQLGVASYTSKVADFKFTETRFTYGAGVGFSLKLVDLGVRFQGHEGASMIGIRAAYNINFKKK